MIFVVNKLPDEIGFCIICSEPTETLIDGWCENCIKCRNLDKVLFLDVDGVLNDERTPTFDSMDPKFISNLVRIIKETGCKIVVSSSWRAGGIGPKSYFYEQLQLAAGNDFDFLINSIVGKTPRIRCQNSRGYEIKQWMDGVGFRGNFVIVDDFSNMEPYQYKLVQTSFCGLEGTTGLTVRLADLIIAKLNEE